MNKVGGFTLSDFKTYYKATGIKIVCYWHKDKYKDQWNRIQSSEIKLYIYGQVVFDNSAKSFNGERILSSTMVLLQLDIPMQNNEVGPLPHIIFKN